MEKQKVNYLYYRYDGEVLQAKREIPFEVKLSSRLILDELCYTWNKAKIEDAINTAIDQRNKEEFINLSKRYKQYIWH